MTRSRLLLPLVAAFLVSTSVRADAPGVYAITGGTVHTASGADIPNGVVIIRDGLIEAAGANVAIPADATVIDVKGQHVYPGLIDAQTSLGFPSPQTTPRRRGSARDARHSPRNSCRRRRRRSSRFAV